MSVQSSEWCRQPILVSLCNVIVMSLSIRKSGAGCAGYPLDKQGQPVIQHLLLSLEFF